MVLTRDCDAERLVRARAWPGLLAFQSMNGDMGNVCNEVFGPVPRRTLKRYWAGPPALIFYDDEERGFAFSRWCRGGMV